MVKRCIRCFKRCFKNLKWLCQALVVRNRMNVKVVDQLDESASYMVLIPHADDEWIGCSQVIRKMKSVFFVDTNMDGGDSPSLHIERKGELQMIASKFNRPLCILEKNKIEELSQIVKNSSPDYILVPFFYDWHPEHIFVMDLLEQVLKKENQEIKVLMYQVSVPIGKKWVNRVMPMCREELREKWNIFKAVYRTQLCIPYFRFAMHELVDGLYSKSFAAEVFVLMNAKDWVNLKTEVVAKALKEKEQILTNLNDISKMRIMVDG